jgi:hypothetical protein
MLHNEFVCDMLVRDHADTLFREAEQERTVRIALAPQAEATPASWTTAAPMARPRRGNSCVSNSGAGAHRTIRDTQAPRRVGRGQVVGSR